MTEKLMNKVAIVTGGSMGIGKATARLLAAEGAAVVIADIASEAGQETVKTIENEGGRAVFVKTDVSKSDQVNSMVELAVKAFGGLHILFANAGIGGYEAPTEAWTDEMWQKIIDVNLTSVFYCCRAAVPAIRRSSGGSIIITSSVAGLTAMSLNCAYNAAKAGVIMLGHTLAQEVAPEIRVNMVAPGLIRTPMNDAYGTPYDIHARQIPMARAGEADDIARTALFLASDESAYITRSVITVDGGMQAGDVNHLWSGGE